MKMSVASLTNFDKEGWLMKTHKITGAFKGWRRRYFIIKDDYLYYFKSKSVCSSPNMSDTAGCGANRRHQP
jgi:hypothetical protein